MANLGERTRKHQILELLIRERGSWVDGTRLSTEEVGGTEGLRRLRELRAEGYRIDERRHPDPRRAIWQYRYVTGPKVDPLRQETEPAPQEVPQAYKFVSLPARIEFGQVAVCPRCKGRTRKYEYENLHGLRHKDPYVNGKPCTGCNGWGIVPNVGPIPLTLPEGLDGPPR